MNITWPVVAALAILALFVGFVILVVASLLTGHRQQRERDARNRRRLREATVTHLGGAETAPGEPRTPETGNHTTGGAQAPQKSAQPQYGEREE